MARLRRIRRLVKPFGAGHRRNRGGTFTADINNHWLEWRRRYWTNLVGPEKGLPTADKVGLGHKVSIHSKDKGKKRYSRGFGPASTRRHSGANKS